MMVETCLEYSQEFGGNMSGGLPQWKRELLQRRAARSRPTLPAVAPVTPPPPAQPPAPPPTGAEEEDEELRYGPGIVKRLKSRYLSLALRDAPRRRPSVLRRAASLEHLLDERPPPSPAPRAHPPRAPRPASLAAPPAARAPSASRRDHVKRAHSVDALSRLEPRDDPVPPPSPPPPPPPAPAPRPTPARATRPPRRPAPLLRDAERPPQDLVRSTLRKFETTPTRRAAPAARVSAVLRGLEGQPRTSTPEPRARSPSPPGADISAVVESDASFGICIANEKRVSRSALESIASAGSSVRYAFEAPRSGSHLPPLSATNAVLLGRVRPSTSPRRIGVIRPMPAPSLERATLAPALAAEQLDLKEPEAPSRTPSPPPVEYDISFHIEKRDQTPSAIVEPIPRSPPEPVETVVEAELRDQSPEPESQIREPIMVVKSEQLVNGFAKREWSPETKEKVKSVVTRVNTTEVNRVWNGTSEKKTVLKEVCAKKQESVIVNGVGGAGLGLAARRGRAPPATTSVVFNFSNRKEVPDYIENDGIILRGSRRTQFKAGESGVVVLRPDALRDEADAEGEVEGEDRGPPSPCRVRFVNDNVLINGRSSMPDKPNKDRIAKLKLQFDDSLTRTFEYPSENSLCEDPTTTNTTAPTPSTAPHQSQLLSNTHIASESLSRYTPHKTLAESFTLGVTRHLPDEHLQNNHQSKDVCDSSSVPAGSAEVDAGSAAGEAEGADARSWSEARAHHTDLLF